MGKPHSLSHHSSRSIGWPEPQGEKSTIRHTFIKSFPPKKQALFALFSFHYYFGLEVNFKQGQSIAEKHLIVLMQTYLLNTAALWYCLCCLNLVLFVDLFSLICFLSFHFVSVRVWNNAIFGNEWHAWMGLGDIFGLYWFSGVCPSGCGHTSIHVTHAIATPMHVRVRNGLPFHFCCLVRHFLTN